MVLCLFGKESSSDWRFLGRREQSLRRVKASCMSVWGMPVFQSELTSPIHMVLGKEQNWLRLVTRFKAIAGLVKETKESTKDAVQTLCKM